MSVCKGAAFNTRNSENGIGGASEFRLRQNLISPPKSRRISLPLQANATKDLSYEILMPVAYGHSEGRFRTIRYHGNIP
jgi:hypothetical protein